MAEEIERSEYYEEREHKNVELIECFRYVAIWVIIIAGLLSIAENVHKFWTSYASCF